MLPVYFSFILFFLWATGLLVKALDVLTLDAEHQWFEPNPRIIIGMFTHCPLASMCLPRELKVAVKGTGLLPYFAYGSE